MYCNKCGNKCEIGINYCNRCGNSLLNKNNTNKLNIIVGISCGSFILFIFFLSLFIVNVYNANYYFSNDNYQNNNTNNNTQTNVNSKYQTVIITDNFYENANISGIKSAEKLIVSDSVNQKNNCPTEIKKIEEKIIDKYGITAVNLCEMDIEFSKELIKVIEKIYSEFPEIRGDLTNLSITNPPTGYNYIAAFMGAFPFASSDETDSYPFVIKTQILFNSKYYLNVERLERDVVSSSKSGHFPPNSNKYSPLAHEFGHYISFITLLKEKKVDSILLVDEKNIYTYTDIITDFSKGNHSKALIEEAYNNYLNDTKASIQFDEWRNTISDYAVAKDNSGNYIYDETIAEGFHDYYLNGDNAKEASKYIIKVLKKHLKGEVE